MPNIELHGYGPKARAMRAKVRKAIALSPDIDEIITSICKTDPREQNGKLVPYLRVISGRREWPDLKKRLTPLNQDIELMFLSKWIPKKK